MTEQVLRARHPETERLGLDVQAALAPAQVTGDPRLVERLVANLVDNALRYNVAHGRIQLAIETDEDHAVLRVSNTGPVIPAEAIDRLRQPFQRLGPDRIHHGDSHGLGLSIVQAIADAHGATLSIRPQQGGGLRVNVTFPTAGPRPGLAPDGQTACHVPVRTP